MTKQKNLCTVENGCSARAATLSRLIEQYEESLRQLKKLSITPQVVCEKDDGNGRRRRGLEMANDWIVSEAANNTTASIQECCLKVKLLKIHTNYLANDHDDPTPAHDLINSLYDDLTQMLVQQAKTNQ